MGITLPGMRSAVFAAITLLMLVDAALAEGLAQDPPQDAKSGYTCVMDPEIWLTSPGRCPRCGMALRFAERPRTAESRAVEPALRTRPDGSISGLSIPDVAVVDQDGRHLRFFTDLVKGHTVAITFMFTTCTTICPPLAATFVKVQEELGAGVGKEILLISVTVDPVTDITPRRKAYMAKFGAHPGWLFVGGLKPDIDDLLRALGAYVSDQNDHTPMILIGNEKAGYWTRVFGLAPPGRVAGLINEAAQKVRKE